MKKFKIIVVFISILIAFGFTLKQDTALSFIDKSGNEVIIQNKEVIPKIIDFDFLKENLFEANFITESNQNSELKFKFTITEFLTANKNQIRMKVLQKPNSNNIEHILKYSSYSIYKMKLKKKNKKFALCSIEYMYSEI